MQKEKQEIKVLKIVNRKKDQKTYQIIREGLDVFVGDPHRYLRWLAEKEYVISERVEVKNYKEWNITQKGKEFLQSLRKNK